MAADGFDPSDMTALVIDENAYARGISLDQLRAMGFRRALGAGSFAEAWGHLTASNPHIVLMEWRVGGADSLDFVRRIRSSEEAPNRAVSVFMLTSRGGLGDVEAARQAGVDGYLRKPISGLVLQQRVRTVVSNPQPFVTTSSYAGPCRRRRRTADYNGPMRRLDDVAPDAPVADEDELDLKAQLARARVAALSQKVDALKPGDANAARAVFKAVQDLAEVAEQIGDTCLLLGAKEMGRYVQSQGATERLSRDVMQTHLAALHQLAHLPISLKQERDGVAQSLKRMIDKKLRQAASAA
jgi:DNA-binding response OmpR family regulator